jgi:hypothetical protein
MSCVKVPSHRVCRFECEMPGAMHHAYHQATSKNPWPAVNQVICDASLGVQTSNPATDGLIPPGDGADRPGPCKGPTWRVFRTVWVFRLRGSTIRQTVKRKNRDSGPAGRTQRFLEDSVGLSCSPARARGCQKSPKGGHQYQTSPEICEHQAPVRLFPANSRPVPRTPFSESFARIEFFSGPSSDQVRSRLIFAQPLHCT